MRTYNKFGMVSVLVISSAFAFGCGTSEDEASSDGSPATSATGGSGGEAGSGGSGGSAPIDFDGDGYTTNPGPNQDCDDANASTHPGAPEVCDDEDNDCDGEIDEDNACGEATTWYRDNDGDSHGDPNHTLIKVKKPDGYVPIGDDCDDADKNNFPGNTEKCDGQDNDCDGEADEGGVCGSDDRDNDGDPNSTDCQPDNPDVHHGATEVCNGIDDDCDGQVDEGCTYKTYYPDDDGDGYGDEHSSGTSSSTPIDGHSLNNSDCDDSRASDHPGATELCGDNRDNDCDGQVDEGCSTGCNEGDQRDCDCSGSSETGTQTCNSSGSWGSCTGCPTPTGEVEVEVIYSNPPNWVMAEPEVQFWYDQYMTGETGLTGCTHPNDGETICIYKMSATQAQVFEGSVHLYGTAPTEKHWGDVSGDVVRPNDTSDRMVCMSQDDLDAQNGQTHLDANGRVEVKVNGVSVALRFKHNPFPKLPSCSYCCSDSPSYPYQNFARD